jgi:hypothetical protein
MKLFNKIIVTVGICMATLGAFAQSGVSLPFIGQGNGTDGGLVPQGLSGYLQITPYTTNSYGATNTYVKGGFLDYAGMSYTNPVTGVVYTGTTNGALPIYVTNTAAFSDIDLWANRDGSALVGNISADVVGYGATFTNTVGFNFAVIDGGGLPINTGTGSGLQFSLTGNGTNDVEVQTNLLVSTTIQGARKLRLLSVTSTGVGTGGTNGQVRNVWLNGYKPGGQ